MALLGITSNVASRTERPVQSMRPFPATETARNDFALD